MKQLSNNDDTYGDTSTLLNKICKLQEKQEKLQQNQNKSREEEYSILREHLRETNILLSELIKVSATGSTIAATKKMIPFDTGSVTVPTANLTKPTNPDDYLTEGIVNVYALNNSTPIQHMTLINDGPGDLYFIAAYSRNEFNTDEGLLHPNDQRELFNVYEVRLRVTQPLTSYRLMEGTFRTGSFSPLTKANVEIRPTIQSNEKLRSVLAVFDITTPITITSPTTQTFSDIINIAPGFQAPLPPGATATFVDDSNLLPMPSLVPEGFIAEAFSALANTSTDCTVRNIVELIPGTFSIISTHPISSRGPIFNLALNLAGQFSTVVIDPNGAPPGGRKFLFTVTNDDPFNNMIGTIMFVIILRRLS